MSKKSKSWTLVSILKLVLLSALALLGFKLLLSLLSAVTIGMAVASVAMWGLAAFVVVGGAGFLALKAFQKKKHR